MLPDYISCVALGYGDGALDYLKPDAEGVVPDIVIMYGDDSKSQGLYTYDWMINKSDNIDVASIPVIILTEDEFSDRSIEFLEIGDVLFYEGEIDEIKATEITGLSSLSSKIKYYVPDAWDNEKVCYPLTNNGVRGYQYYLNVLTQNTKYAELFYIFYFDNEEYLKDPFPLMTLDEYCDLIISCLQLMNILPDENIIYPQAQIKTLKGTGDVEVQYYDTTCKTQSKSGKKEYNVEFVFKPDSNGIVCMLYLYYPGDKSKENDHAGEVGYVVKTLVTQ